MDRHSIKVDSPGDRLPALGFNRGTGMQATDARTAPRDLAALPGAMRPALLRHRLAAEALGTAFLLIAVVGSGILAERLADGNTALALLANALATGAALYALIEWLAPMSGAHFNPLISAAMAFRGDITGRVAVAYISVQMIGAVIGVGVAVAMFDAPIFSLATHVRSGTSQLLSEFVVTFGLVGLVWACSQQRPSSVASVVAAYIGGAFWFTATGFANPAVVLARAFTDTFSGIRLSDVPGFIAAQIVGTVVAVMLFRWLLPNTYSMTEPDAVHSGNQHKENY